MSLGWKTRSQNELPAYHSQCLLKPLYVFYLVTGTKLPKNVLHHTPWAFSISFWSIFDLFRNRPIFTLHKAQTKKIPRRVKKRARERESAESTMAVQHSTHSNTTLLWLIARAARQRPHLSRAAVASKRAFLLQLRSGYLWPNIPSKFIHVKPLYNLVLTLHPYRSFSRWVWLSLLKRRGYFYYHFFFLQKLTLKSDTGAKLSSNNTYRGRERLKVIRMKVLWNSWR